MNTLLLWALLLPATLFGSVSDTLPNTVYTGGDCCTASAPSFRPVLSNQLPRHARLNLFATPTHYTLLRPQVVIGATSALLSGAAWGLHEATMHHWPQFAARFPNANPYYWNPAESWRNKYIDGDPAKGRTNVPVLLTDAKHPLASLALSGGWVAGACITLGGKRPWWHYAADAFIYSAAWWVGNRTTYQWIY